jgi:hypothetical protein
MFSTKIVNHGSRRGDAMHRRIHMAIKIASNSPAFFVVADSLLPTNIAK